MAARCLQSGEINEPSEDAVLTEKLGYDRAPDHATRSAARALPALVFGFWFALAIGAPAYAQCTSTCTEYEEGECVEFTNSCTPLPSAPAVSYGSIAYSRSSAAWGYSYGWGSQAKAENVAMQNCAQHGDGCAVMVWFRNECGAVAASDAPDAFWGLGYTDSQARTAALNKCGAGGRQNCEVVVSQCSN